MKVVGRVLTSLVLVCATAAVAAGQRGAPPPGNLDEQALKKEVNAFMDQYWSLWSAGDIDQLAARIYHPFGQLNNGGHTTVEQMRANFPQSRKALTSKGYGRSQMPMGQRNVCILAPNVAVVSGRGVRYLTDGSVMAEFGWTYTLLKNDSGWRMVSIYSHDPKKALTCN